MEWQFNTYSIVLFASAIIAAIVAIDARKKINHTPAASTFIILMSLIALWSAGYAVELSGAGYFTAFLGVKMSYPGIVSVPVLFLIFAARYGETDAFLNRFTIAALFVIPCVTLVLNWSSEYHRLFYESYSLDFSSSNVILTIVPGPWYWVHLVYSYACLMGATVILARKLREMRNLFREQLILIISGITLPWAGNALDVFVRPFPHVNLCPLSFILMGIIFYYALFRKRFLDIIPVARDKIIESMADGVLVLDIEGRIIDINRSLIQMSEITDVDIIGLPGEKVFASIPPLAECISAGKDGVEDVSVIINGNQLTYRVRSTPLFSAKRRQIGTLFMISDMTGLFIVMSELESARDDLQGKNQLILSMNRDLEERVNQAVIELREKEELLTLQGRYAAMGEMIDFIAHQWKQHLYAASLRIEAMKKRINRGDAVKQEDVVSIEAAIKNMNDTLREFRNFVTPGGKSARVFRIGDAVDSALSLIEDILKVDGITVKKNYSVYPSLSGQINELSQVVLNIINNTRGVSRVRNIERAEVQIDLYRVGESAMLSFTDNAGGIDREDLPHLFNKFYTRTSGSGLGLYMSRMIIEQHFNGTIRAESEGGEATFTISFPSALF